MYCKNCGKQIDNDSKFCKHCGTQLADGTEPTTSTKSSLYSKFQSLSTKRQIAALCYGVWFLGWICPIIVCCEDDNYAENVLLPAFIAVILFPFFSCAIFYIIKLIKRNKRFSSNSKANIETSKPILQAEPIKRKEMERFSLNEFALLYGKMQVKVATMEDGTKISYCTFTHNGVETKVDFDNKLGLLTASEISARKLDLCIVEYEHKEFVLTEK